MNTAEQSISGFSRQGSCTDCQSFPEGCVGCCVNMHWSDKRIRQYLQKNTEFYEKYLPQTGQLSYWSMVCYYFRRGALLDGLLTVALVLPTFGISAVLWQRFLGSCPFAGYLDASRKRAGCLIHPARLGLPDARRHSFPMLPLIKCNRLLRCPALDNSETNWSMELLQASRICHASLTSRSWRIKVSEAWNDFLRSMRLLPSMDSGAVLLEYVMIMTGVLFVLISGQTILFDMQGSINGNLGALGDAFREFYRNLVAGLSMPIP